MRRSWIILLLMFIALTPYIDAQTYADQLRCSNPLSFDGPRGDAVGRGDLSLGLEYDSPTAPDDGPILGTLITEEKPWSVGGSGTMTLTTNQPIWIESLLVPEGAYSLFFLLSKGNLVLIVNKEQKREAAYDARKDLGRVVMRAAPSANCSVFTLNFPFLVWDGTKRQTGLSASEIPRLLLSLAWREANYEVPIIVKR